MRLPDINGIDVLRGIKEDNPEAYTIIITAYASKENAIEALKIGVHSYLEKLSGYSREEIEEKKSWTDFIVGMKEYHEERGKDGKEVPAKYKFRAVDKGGNIKTIYLNMGMIPGTKKSVASFIDITGRRQKEILEAHSELRTILSETSSLSFQIGGGWTPSIANSACTRFFFRRCFSCRQLALCFLHLITQNPVDFE